MKFEKQALYMRGISSQTKITKNIRRKMQNTHLGGRGKGALMHDATAESPFSFPVTFGLNYQIINITFLVSLSKSFK